MTDGLKLDSDTAYPRNSARSDSRVPTKARKLIAKSSIQINNTVDAAWKALVDPEIVAKYMLGSQQVSDWQKGSSIIWRLHKANGYVRLESYALIKSTSGLQSSPPSM